MSTMAAGIKPEKKEKPEKGEKKEGDGEKKKAGKGDKKKVKQLTGLPPPLQTSSCPCVHAAAGQGR